MTNSCSPSHHRCIKPLLLFMVLVVVAGHLYNYCTKGTYPGPFEYGLYDWDRWGEKNDKRKMRWTGKVTYQRTTAEADILGFRVFAAPYNIDKNALELSIYINGELLDKMHFMESGYKPRYYYLPGMAGQNMSLEMKVSKTFNPYKLRINKDTRDLGVAISPLTFLKIMPEDGVGFYERKSWDIVKYPSVPKNPPIRFRWTGMRASMNVQAQFQEGGELFLMCNHPDIAKKPVVVDIIRDGDRIRRETFKDHKWKKVVIKTEDVTETTALTFQVSQTWNPKLEGISDDSRDLGVAVGFKPFRPHINLHQSSQ